MSEYKRDLEEQLKTVKSAIKKALNYRNSLKFNGSKWWQANTKINSLNIKKITIKSRIENIGKNYGGIESFKISLETTRKISE